MSPFNDDTIEFICRHCDAQLSFPVAVAGRVEVCPECANYVDVPEQREDFTTLQSPSVTLPSGQEFPLEMREGLTRPRWDLLIPEIMGTTPQEELNECFTVAVRCWLSELARSCGRGYDASESANFHLMSKLDEGQAAVVHRHCEQTLSKILDLLDGIADDSGYGPHVILLFHSHRLFYSYIAPFHPEGEFGGAGGIFLTEGGYPHIAAPFFRDHWQGTIVHELVHALVSHLPLPLWLNEGVTMLVEWQLTSIEPVDISPQVRAQLRQYWQENGLEGFWSGDSFSAPDEGQQLSYTLAFLTAVNLSLDHKKRFRDFVSQADFQDAGANAARDTLGSGIDGIMCRMLGEGSWSPRQRYSLPNQPLSSKIQNLFLPLSMD